MTRPNFERPVVVVLASAQRRGAEIQGVGLARDLQAHGYEASVVALTGGGGEPLPVPVLGERALAPSCLRTLRRTVAGTAVVAHGSTTLPAVALATMATRTPWLYRSIGDPAAWVRGPAHRARTGWLMSRAEFVVALWPAAAETLQRLYRLPPERVAVIPNNRDPVAFPPITAEERAAVRGELGLEGPVVLYLGALSEEKRPLEAVRAVAGLAEATLVVAGTGPLEPAVRQLGETMAPGRVRLVGQTADPGRIMAAADVLVLPSRTEGMPGVIIEAQFRGLPVVATAVGAVPDMVGDDGVVVPPGDTAALTEALRAVLAEPARHRHVARSRAVARYGHDEVVARWERVLADLTGR